MKSRVRYIDVLRGVTMLLVIYQHVRSFSIGLAVEDSDLAELFILFRMPMFFFLSGYIAYKSVADYNFGFYLDRLFKKAKIQLIPTVVFFVLLSLYTANNVIALSFPSGYWFTVVLFEMFAIYFTCSVFCHYTNPNLLVPVMVIVAFGITLMPVPKGDVIHCLSLSQLRGFFRYFVLGLICRKYYAGFISLFTNNVYSSMLIVLSVILLTLSHLGISTGMLITDLAMEFVLKSSLVLVIFMFFYRHQDYWSRDSKLAKALNFVGRRTLDLYMLHYFFLPNLPELYDFFAAPGNEVIEFVLIGAITIAVAAISLLASSILRCSPFLAKWLFGVSLANVAVSHDSLIKEGKPVVIS